MPTSIGETLVWAYIGAVAVILMLAPGFASAGQ